MTTRDDILAKLLDIERQFSALTDVSVIDRARFTQHATEMREILRKQGERKPGPTEYKERDE